MKLPWRKTKNKRVSDEAPTGTELVLKIGALGWTAWTYRLDEGLGQRWAGEAGDLEEQGSARLTRILRLAMQTLPQTVLKEPGPLTLLLDSDDIHYVDSRAQPLAAGGVSAATIRRHGIQLLDVRDVSYGRTALNGSSERQIYGFIDSRVLGEYLAALDKNFSRLEAVRGCAEALIQRGMSGDDEVYAGLHVSGEHVRLVLLNRRLGAVLVRTFPTGVLTLAGQVAELSGIPRKEALEGLAERDYLSGTLPSLRGAGEIESVHLGPIERALAPALKQLANQIRTSIDFFADQQACGRPGRLEVLGETDRLQGVAPWLGTVLGENGAHAPITVDSGECGDWPAGSVGVGVNLLTGVEGSGLSIGKLHYAYVNRRLVMDNKRGAARRASARSVREVEGGGNPAGTTAGSGMSRARNARSGQVGEGGWFRRLLSSESSAPDDDLPPATARQYLMLAYVLMAALLFLAWDEYERLAKRHDAEAVAYINALNTQTSLRQQLRDLGYTQAPIQVEVDKVLWTEKFLSLADRINAHLWLTQVYLSEEERQLDKIKVVSKKLVIEGAALPSTRGHVAEIADYMARLEADQNGFMVDFREIAFEGSRIDDKDQDHIVRFTLAGWYDENKRLEDQGAPRKHENAPVSLDHTLDNVENRNRTLERARRGDL
ncbi:MAG: hypothetical protein H6981_01540 [Gammaproteobacteria bacterium]|nr:hypothetical protein [Gammaproteobacteria bacterium]MCP5135470.1 hypothetical protein [Gammaproteobacteria bacterium]